MTANDAISQPMTIVGWIGLALALVALAKFFGVNVPVRGAATDTAMVAIACLLSR